MIQYSFYVGAYKGSSITGEDWSLFEARAAEQIKRYKRIYTVKVPDDDAEAMAICAMADALAYFAAVQNGNGGAVQSASIGSVSVSYGGMAAGVDLTQRGQERELYRCASQYLEIYRGVG